MSLLIIYLKSADVATMGLIRQPRQFKVVSAANNFRDVTVQVFWYETFQEARAQMAYLSERVVGRHSVYKENWRGKYDYVTSRTILFID